MMHAGTEELGFSRKSTWILTAAACHSGLSGDADSRIMRADLPTSSPAYWFTMISCLDHANIRNMGRYAGIIKTLL